jgi:ComEC/Rec2-related protein
MVRWWAAFFIAGLAAPPGCGMQIAVCHLTVGLVLGGLAFSGRCAGARRDGIVRRPLDRAGIMCVIILAAGIVVWEGAGLQRTASDRARLDATAGAWAGSGAGARSGATFPSRSRTGDVSAFRALSLTGARSWFLERLDDGRLSKRARALVGALILDDRKGLDFALRETYSYVGITHFLALSGLHLSAIAIPLSGALSRAIRSKRRADAALCAILCLYSAVAGFPASLLRALFLTATVLGYRFLGLHVDLFGALAAGSLMLVAVDPAVALDAGFQLSFAAVWGIAFIGVPVSEAVEPFLPGGFARRILKALLYPALITCSVQFFTMPLTVALFGRSSLLSPLVNIVVSVPFTILLYAGALYVFIPLAMPRALLSFPINALCRFLGEAPAAFTAGPHRGICRGSFWTGAYFAGVALVVLSLRPRSPRRRLLLGAGIASLVTAFLLPPDGEKTGDFFPGRPGTRPDAEARVSAFRGGFYLSDGGGIVFIEESFGARESYRLTRALWGMGIDRIRCCVVEPSRLRRNSGVSYLLARVSVEEVFCSPYLAAGAASWGERLGGRKVRVKAVSRGDVVECPAWRLEILAPEYPPPREASVSRADAGLAWRFMVRNAAGATMLDLKGGSGYHAVP